MNRQQVLDFKLREDATFATYLGQAANRLRDPAGWIYVWGQKGTGRSHLLQAACHHKPGSIYLSELDRLDPAILSGLDHVGLVCLDDVKNVLGHKDWEEALFHLLNAVRDQGNSVIISGDVPASQLPVGLADLKSRLVHAVSIETDYLDDDQKLELLMTRADRRGFKLNSEVGRFILARVDRDMHRLLDLLERLELASLSEHKKLTIPFVKQTLSL